MNLPTGIEPNRLSSQRCMKAGQDQHTVAALDHPFAQREFRSEEVAPEVRRQI